MRDKETFQELLREQNKDLNKASQNLREGDYGRNSTDKELTREKQYEGELLTYEDKNFTIKVSYFPPGAISVFSRLEVFILYKNQLRLARPEKKMFDLFRFLDFFPYDKESQKNRALSFARVRTKTGKTEKLVISTGNSTKKGLFYYPDCESSAIELIEFGEKPKIHEDNFKLIPIY